MCILLYQLQHTASHCNTLQHTATLCCTLCILLYDLQHTATHCNTLQHTATHCYTHMQVRKTLALQHTGTHSNTLQHTATHCSTLQHTATHCSTLQHRLYKKTHCNTHMQVRKALLLPKVNVYAVVCESCHTYEWSHGTHICRCAKLCCAKRST